FLPKIRVAILSSGLKIQIPQDMWKEPKNTSWKPWNGQELSRTKARNTVAIMALTDKVNAGKFMINIQQKSLKQILPISPLIRLKNWIRSVQNLNRDVRFFLIIISREIH